MTVASAAAFASPPAPKCSASKVTWLSPLRAKCQGRQWLQPPKPKKAAQWEPLKKRNTKI